MSSNATAAAFLRAPGKRLAPPPSLAVVVSALRVAMPMPGRSGEGLNAMRDSRPKPQSSDATCARSGPGIALRDYGIAELDVAIESLVLRGSHIHEGIHHARKAIRRTRAMLALGAPALGPGARLVSLALREVNHRLSPLRDAHALVETLDRVRTKARDDATREALDHARGSASRRRAAMAQEPEFTRELQHAQAIVTTLRAALTGLPWGGISPSVVTDAMATAQRKAASARERACKRDDAKSWHRWRRRMRRISQQHRAVTAAGVPVNAAEFDKDLTEQLGVLQDLNLLVAHCGKDSPFSTDRSTLRRLAKRTLAKQRKRIRSVVTLVNAS